MMLAKIIDNVLKIVCLILAYKRSVNLVNIIVK